MQQKRYTAHEIAAELGCSPRAIGRALNEKLAQHVYHVCLSLFGGSGTVEGSEYMIGNVHGAPGRSLRVHLTGQKAGKWKDFAGDAGGTMLDLIRDRQSTTHFLDTCTEAVRILQLPITPMPEADANGKPISAEVKSKKNVTEWLWSKTSFAVDTPAGLYLKRRGFTAPYPARVRMSRSAKHPETGDQLHCAVVALVTDVGDQPIGLHRVYVERSGEKLSTVAEPKSCYGSINGGAVRLNGIKRETLILAEGMEDGMSVLSVLPDWPVWYGPTAAHLAAVQLPPWVSRVVVAAQNDAAGLIAARKIQLRLGGIVAIEIMASLLKDWDLDRKTYGASFLQERLNSVIPPQKAAAMAPSPA
jgi:hypothetical protein